MDSSEDMLLDSSPEKETNLTQEMDIEVDGSELLVYDVVKSKVSEQVEKIQLISTEEKKINFAITTLYEKLLLIIARLLEIVKSNDLEIPTFVLPPRPVLLIESATDLNESEEDKEVKNSKSKKKIKPISEIMEELENSIKVQNFKVDENITFDEKEKLTCEQCVEKIKLCYKKIDFNDCNNLLVHAILGKTFCSLKTQLRKKKEKFELFLKKHNVNPRKARRDIIFYYIYKAKNNVVYSKKAFRWFCLHGKRIIQELERK